MFWRILKKDLKRKKGINIILFIFMILATTFVASSVNNILVVTNATDYCMEKGNVPDDYIAAYEKNGDNSIQRWLEGDGKQYYNDYSLNYAIMLTKANVVSYGDKSGDSFDVSNMIMISKLWEEHLQVFDKDGGKVTINDGEIAMTQSQLDNNNLSIGDNITIKVGNVQKTFIINQKVLDPGLGGDFVGLSRYFISENDYNELAKGTNTLCANYCINTDNITKLMSEFNKQDFTIMVSIEKQMFSFAYIIKMITAGILIIVGVCLILISFLILRFTIVFTLQEDFKEIGIMKAIGIKNMGIRKIYMIKYLMLIIIAGIIGCALSIPVSTLLMKSVAKDMMMESATTNLFVNILCSIGVIILVMLICFLCTNKLRKFSAIEAIRSGQTGERFRRKSIFSLHKRKKMITPLYLAINDILSNIKRYIVLILTFVIGTIIIILPVNTITSMSSKEMARNFVLDPEADLYVSIDSADDSGNYDKELIEKTASNLKEDFMNIGYEADINTLIYCSISVFTDNPDEVTNVMAAQPYNSDGSYIQFTKGEMPALENEIAMSEMLMKDLDVKIGDTVNVRADGNVYEFIVSASYQNFMQMGKSAIVSESFKGIGKTVAANSYFQCYIKDAPTDILKIAKEKFPNYKIFNIKQAIGDQLGSTIDQMSSIKYIIVVLICAVNLMITILMVKIFILGEKGQIAMLRSIGYTNNALRCWQVFRISIVLLISEILGIILSTFLNNIVVRPIFGLMGATHMKISVNPIEVYIIYPVILLTVIIIAAVISTRNIKKLNIMEINNVE